jgi:DNA-binding transcriptional ArsR family regulator
VSDNNPKKSSSVDGNFKTLAFVAKALSDENRLRILLSVSNGKKSVSSIVEELELSQHRGAQRPFHLL